MVGCHPALELLLANHALLRPLCVILPVERSRTSVAVPSKPPRSANLDGKIPGASEWARDRDGGIALGDLAIRHDPLELFQCRIRQVHCETRAKSVRRKRAGWRGVGEGRHKRGGGGGNGAKERGGGWMSGVSSASTAAVSGGTHFLVAGDPHSGSCTAGEVVSVGSHTSAARGRRGASGSLDTCTTTGAAPRRDSLGVEGESQPVARDLKLDELVAVRPDVSRVVSHVEGFSRHGVRAGQACVGVCRAGRGSRRR